MNNETRDQLAVSCKALVKQYGNGETAVQALRGIDLEVRTGELLMLVGPSGCGKTTLISVLAGILDADSGACVLFDRELISMHKNERAAFRGRNIGFVFQSFNLIPALTATENVSVPLRINGMSEREARSRSAAILRETGLGEKEHALPSQLSGGQQQRVAIARALVHNPRLVVCDEPTSALDHGTGQRIMQMLKRIAVNHDRSLVIVTHDARIFEFADRIAHMDDGRIQHIEHAIEKK
jgi:putative ABC transport system ATP-binding protein